MKAALLSLAVALAVVSQARAEGTIDQIVNAYEAGSSTTRDRIELILNSNFNGIQWSNEYSKHQTGNAFYCGPQKHSPGGRELVDLLREYAHDEPKAGEFPYGMGLLLAMSYHFPCKANN